MLRMLRLIIDDCVEHPMTKATLSIFSLILVLLLSKAVTSAALVEADDPRYGAGTLTLDTSSGLAWVDLPVSSGYSYLQALAATQPGGTFGGFRFATAQEVVALYASAGIPGPGWYPESTPSLQPILSLISLVGATTSQDNRPEAHGISGTAFGNDSHWGVGLDFFYMTGVPGYGVNGLPGQQPGFAIGDTASLPVYGNWLVQPIPEPSPWGFGGLAVLVFWARRLVARRYNISGCLEACPSRLPHLR
jgi:hypothetical protein